MMQHKRGEGLCLVTGATGDIGSAICRSVLEDGYTVIGVSRNTEKMESDLLTDFPDRLLLRNVDVRDHKQVTRLFNDPVFEINQLSIVVTCAGVLHMSPTVTMPQVLWEDIIQTNLIGTSSVVRESLPHLSKGGLVALIGSRWGVSGAVNAAAYSASKSALRAFARSLQLEYCHSGIRIVLVSPGSVQSQMSDSVDSTIASTLVPPKEIGRLIKFLASTPSSVAFDEIVIKALPYDYES